MKTYPYISFILSLTLFLGCNMLNKGLADTELEKVNEMPFIPVPYKMLDWNEKAKNFDEIIFNFKTGPQGNPFIWLDTSQRNFPQTTFGLYTVIGDIRQGPDVNNGEFHEAINSLGALMSAGLVGIDKTNQNGFNYVGMVQNYFNSDNGWNIMMNNTSEEVALLGGGYGRDWWYDVFPNVLYFAVSDLFQNVDRADSLQKIISEQFYKADSVLNGNYNFSYFDYSSMEGKNNTIPPQQDAAAGHAWVLYSAYQKFGEERYLKGAQSALDALFAQKESRFYEVFMPFGAYTSARMNAELDTDYDVLKLLKWTFDGCKAKDGRTGWGIISGKWGDFDINGIQGNTIQEGGYGFLMNTFDMAWPLVPMVRYEPEYAALIGKWMLNAANSARLFYPYEIPDKNQWLPNEKSVTRNVIAYEGLKKTDAYSKEELKGVSPVALGDGPNWVIGQPDISMFSIYGSAHVGIFGSIIKETNIDKILQLDCLATDFYRNPAFPTYLYYNPYHEDKEIEFFNYASSVDLYDAISHKKVAKNILKNGVFTIPADEPMLIVVVPTDSKIERYGNRIMIGDTVVAYQ